MRGGGQRRGLAASAAHLREGRNVLLFPQGTRGAGPEGYRAGVAGRRPDLPTAFLQCGDFAWEQRRWWENEGAATHLPYWREHLRGVSPLALPTLGPDDASLAGSQVRRRLEPELVAAMPVISRRKAGR